MKKFLLFSLILAISPVWSAPTAPAKLESQFSPLPAGCKATLHFARTKVAVGAIADDAHQSEWWIEVRDAKGKPKSGVAVDLPLITKGGQGKGSEKGDGVGADNSIVARLEWLPSQGRAKNPVSPLSNRALTSEDGRARGLFTSGNRTQKVEFVSVGGAKSSILQVWSEDEGWIQNVDDYEGEGHKVRCTPRFFEGGKWIPITGHRLYLEPQQARLALNDPRLGPDEDGDGQPDGLDEIVTFSQEQPEIAGWKAWLSWSKYSAMTEITPGVYEGFYEYTVPEEVSIDGRAVTYVEEDVYNVRDNDAFEDE